MEQNRNSEGLRSSQNLLRSPLLLAIIASLAIGGISVYTVMKLQAATNEKQKAPVAVQPVIKTVTALGRLEPKGEVIKLSAPSSNGEGNRVEQLLVKEGDRVKAGQIVAIMDNRDRLQATLGEAQKQVQVVKSRLNQVKAGAKQGEIGARQATVNRVQVELQGNIKTQQATINRLEAELLGQQRSLQATVARVAAEKGNAQADVQRYETLYKAGAISSQEVDKRRLSAETSTQALIESQATQTRTVATLQQQLNEAKANQDQTLASLQQQINEAKANLNQTTEVRPTDIANAQAEIDSAQATVEKIRAELAEAYVVAPKVGRILEINTRAGETVGNEGIVALGQTDQMYAVVEVYQSDIKRVRPGQPVLISSDSLRNELEGRVDWIGMQVKRQNLINADPSSNIDARVVEVHVQLNKLSSQNASSLTNLQVKAVIEL
ncbi:HlyD family efflux transporter periplasmic adaptor subunit [Nostoc sp. 'Lobaria pulmonaria (5183) cyanobiont']|uniref:HlyD family efflux transporter periplasmic adaptor subunit n=1 Tax=Nostoc sp. 'Lobaria pulmonaria (5183) cyanobiont' TaxID=1618022 RepID=UPI000CF31E7D|nr:HlyD family efflux transporter periplasmic adaptor subunit [Nostoc sp. 'Lobaria pulmonaria (5183) cyanobiont']AVH72159.1 ABC transporter membrane fusion protein DevB [Nostoc sp. 'Lobaria pulmonaria (5183) cyanobiont']